MSTTATIPLLAPDGQVHLVPQDQASAAIQAGGKPVAQMSDPQGQARWIPSDQVEAAQAAGGTLISPAAMPGLQLSNPSSVPNARIRNLPNPAANETSALGALFHGAKAGLTLGSIPASLGMSAPQLAGGIIGGTVGNTAGTVISKAAGAGPMGQEISGDIGGLVGGLYGAGRASSATRGFIENFRAGLGETAPSSTALPAAVPAVPEGALPTGQAGSIADSVATPSGAGLPRTLSGESALGQVLSRLDNASLLKIARSRGINVSQEALLKPGTANGKLIAKITADFSPDELDEFRSQYLENTRLPGHQFGPNMTDEAYSTIATQSYFPDVKIPKTVMTRTQQAMANMTPRTKKGLGLQ